MTKHRARCRSLALLLCLAETITVDGVAGLTAATATIPGFSEIRSNSEASEKCFRRLPGVRLIQLPETRLGEALERNWAPHLPAAYEAPSTRGESGVPPSTPMVEVEDLPLIVTPATGQPTGDRFGVFLTGDGGWGVTDQGVCRGLASHGIPMVALNSLKYFWRKRTPDSSAADLERILRHYLGLWNKQKVVLIGYSMGADVLPFMVNRLPADLLDRVELMVLLGPSETVEFEFHFRNWFTSGSNSKSLAVLPELEKLRGRRILAFYGTEETDSLCRKMSPSLARIVELKGGHRIRGNYGPVLDGILSELG